MPLEQYIAALIEAIAPGSKLVAVQQLTGGTSATITRIDLELPHGVVRQYVVRQYGARDLAQNTGVATLEFAVTKLLFEYGLPVPEPVLIDGEASLSGAPLLVQHFLPGVNHSNMSLDFDFGRPMAEFLIHLRGLDRDELAVANLPDAWDRARNQISAGATGNSPEWQLLDRLAPSISRNAGILLHGDFWPGNIRWNEDGIAGVIDWEDSVLGDPLQDLANAEFELEFSGRSPDAKRLIQSYRSVANIEDDRLDFWRLYAAARAIDSIPRWGLAAEVESRQLEYAREFAAHHMRRWQAK